MSSAKPALEKEWKITGCKNMATMRSRKMMEGASRRGFVRQTKPDHTLGASIAISILSGGWALGGFIDLDEGRDEYGSGRLAESHHSAECGPLESRWLLACPYHAISSHDWTTDGRCRRRGWLHPGPSHAPRKPDSAWCWLIARFMSAQKQTFEVWLVEG